MKEEVHRFARRHSLAGVVTVPDVSGEGASRAGVIFLNAGLLHRVGPNRIFVALARRLTDLGLISLRFDHSGIGDSGVRSDNLSFEKASIIETQEAMNFLSRQKRCTDFYIVGLCSGTLTAFRTACSDSRVSGIILLNALLENPDSISESVAGRVTSRKILRSYWTDKLFRPESWKRLLTGRTGLSKVARVTRNALTAPGQTAAVQTDRVERVVEDLRRLADRGTGILFVFGGATTFLEYFRLTLASPLRRLSAAHDVSVEILERADHTFTRLQHQSRLESIVHAWLAARIALPEAQGKARRPSSTGDEVAASKPVEMN